MNYTPLVIYFLAGIAVTTDGIFKTVTLTGTTIAVIQIKVEGINLRTEKEEAVPINVLVNVLKDDEDRVVDTWPSNG